MAATYRQIDFCIQEDWSDFIKEVYHVYSLRELGALSIQAKFHCRLVSLRIKLFKRVIWYCMKNNLLQENLPYQLQDAIETLFFMRTDYYDSYLYTVL
jgi:hypothetical protein